ncbi:MAG TPA: hypothetical protein VLX56_07700 [Nitrososphaerales archaeon]|nr:hypothetical protein [Nitrososphaerales archaeon]
MSKRQGAKARALAPAPETDPNTQTILTVLKTYPSNEVAIVGCHTARISRESCEYDLLVVSRDPTPPKYVRVGESYAKVVFRSERDLRDPEPELSASLARATVLRDASLLLAGVVSSAKRRFKQSCGRAAESHLAGALKALGRVNEKVGDDLPEADFWLTSAATDLALAEIFSDLQVPSPSHLFAQMKGLSRRRPASFREWTEASGFNLASKSSCEVRLETLSILYDVMRTSAMDMPTSLKFGRYRSDDAMAIVRGKANELLASLDTVECYSFLGYEVVRTFLDVHAMRCHALRKEPDYSQVTKELTSGPDRLISEEILRGMGLLRPTELLRAGADSLAKAVAALAAKM